MATKKQKREAAEAKRAAFEAQLKADGLRAQKADQEHRQQVEASYREEARRINERHMQILAKASMEELEAAGRFAVALALGGWGDD
jgi:hypothetical protein